MRAFKFGDRVRYNIFCGHYVGIGIYLGYDEEEQSHIIGCSKKRADTKLQWALYANGTDDLELLERPNTRLLNVQPTEPTEPTEPTVLEDLIDEL